MSCNHIMAGLFRADMLCNAATGQVASIPIRGRNQIHIRCSLSDSSLSDAPRYLCLLSDSAEWGLNQVQNRVRREEDRCWTVTPSR